MERSKKISDSPQDIFYVRSLGALRPRIFLCTFLLFLFGVPPTDGSRRNIFMYVPFALGPIFYGFLAVTPRGGGARRRGDKML